MTTLTFYHSVICPRCQAAGLFLSRMLRDFPEIELEKVEYLANLGAARQEGVRSIPTLKAEDKELSGFILTPKRMRRFLESL